MKISEDNVRFYWIPRGAVARTLTLGSSVPEEPPSVYIIAVDRFYLGAIDRFL